MIPYLSSEERSLLNGYWRAANYIALGQLYLIDNPLLKKRLELKHIKKRLLGHWGTTPGLNFIYLHLNRIIKKNDLDMILVTGPGHGAPAIVANTYLEGTYSELYSNVSQDTEGMKELFRQFSYPGGIPSHTAATTPGSINEGGELGYSLAHAYGAAFDHPDLIVACVVGDGEAESGPLATSWHSNKFLNPTHDGAVLPILHLNGYKIAEPTLLARISHEELESLFKGYGYKPYLVEGDDPEKMHDLLAKTLDQVILEIKEIQTKARKQGFKQRPIWPMIIFKSPKGWTCPKIIDGLQVEGTWRSHQIPLDDLATKPKHLSLLEEWFKSYNPEELFDELGRLHQKYAELAPEGNRRMGSNPYANGGLFLHDLKMPNFRDYSFPVSKPGKELAESTRILGGFLRDIMKANWDLRNFRLFGPDETASNRLTNVFDITDRTFTGEILPSDDHVSPDGRVMEVLSEHLCEGWLEGYLLTGRHGLFSCYEAFIHIIDSMFNQHAKWLEVCKEVPWRRSIASLNYLLTSHVWRQDHNGFSHQDPGFIDLVLNKKSDIVRVYLPPDANTLLSVTDHCLRSKNYINVIIAGKQKQPQWLDMQAAVKHCTAGISIWTWASNDEGERPDLIMASAGDVPTLESLAAVELLRHFFPDLKIRVINVVNLMTLQSKFNHSHGLSDKDYDALFLENVPVIFAFHGYPTVIHRLIYSRKNAAQFHVHGYREEGTTTTPFDMVVCNDLDRFHLVANAIDRIPELNDESAYVKQFLQEKLVEHKEYICKHGEDMPEIQNWRWGQNFYKFYQLKKSA